MDIKNNSPREALVTLLENQSGEHLDLSEARRFLSFANNALHMHPDMDFLDRPAEETFKVIYGLYKFTEFRKPNEIKIDAFNTELERDGWKSSYTMIFINLRDMPFLVDSIRMLLNRRGLNIYTMQSNPIWIRRDPEGRMICTYTEFTEGVQRESVVGMGVDLHSDHELPELKREILSVLNDVEVVVDDFKAIRNRVNALIEELTETGPDISDREESLAFLRWISDGYFTFLGAAEFRYENSGDDISLVEQPESRLGLLAKYGGDARKELVSQLNTGVKALCKSDDILAFGKSSKHSRVHRDIYSDYVVVKRFDANQNAVGEVRFLGLYTSQVYSYSPTLIPVIRKKVDWIMAHSGFEKQSHDGKALLNILEFHPRDELFHIDKENLAETAIAIWRIYERRVVKVFMNADSFDKFVSCIIYVPRESYDTSLLERIQKTIGEQLDAEDSEFSAQFLFESVLVRIHMVFQVRSKKYLEVDCAQLEETVAKLTHDWCEEFAIAATEAWGEQDGAALSRKYQRAFPVAYRDRYSPQHAIRDVELMNSLGDGDDIAIDFRDKDGSTDNRLQLKLFHRGTPLELSSMIPMLENLGFRVLVERPYRIWPQGDDLIWMQDFHLDFSLAVDVNVSAVRNSFAEALKVVWKGDTEDDNFNRLVIGARLDWRSVAMLRLYARYLKQLGVTYSQDFIADTLARHLDITRNLIALFKSYFDPRYVMEKAQSQRPGNLSNKILTELDDVDNINEDNVLRLYLELIEATQRTNFFQAFEKGNIKPYISVKLTPDAISIAPKPRPAYEIFVYSARIEGVHLRGGKVARGGLRWSDRLEDYRTEILGLVKAQQVKNAVIVPTGAKGGFVAKLANPEAGREAWLEEGRACYMLYIQALLDITDNLIDGEIVSPRDVVCRDDDDPYLVVAADKGTATFSDIANDIAQFNGFWMGDAFASGGSNGYDHKGMGITAKGAWVAVQRHFREIGVNIQKEDFTVVGIGDMAGDVFGNGMLLSEHTQLVAAFNHLHIFIDPTPDAATTYVERKRLFETPGTTWDDFDKTLLSSGGGVFSRLAKVLDLTPEIRQRFGIEVEQLTPSELIKHILKSEVDLIWNGGIGTYVKARAENDAEVGDRANDSLRVDGHDLRCKVFGEGGNLGMTQLGRIEFCLKGGICNTDFIDNAGGVDCSDHEVNIKILLNEQVATGQQTMTQRNQMLEEMTDSVSELVLHNNYRQTQSISLSLFRSQRQHAEYQRFMEWLEGSDRLDRALEFLPSDDQLMDRQNRAYPLWTRPELSVLISYSKILLKEQLLEDDLVDEPFLASIINTAFPLTLVSRFEDQLQQHQLRSEIVATQLANDLVNRMGFTFFFRQMESTGASAGEVLRAYTIVMNILNISRYWEWIESHDYQISANAQHELFHILIRLVRRATRWFLRNRRQNLSCGEIIGGMSEPVQEVLEYLAQLHEASWLQLWEETEIAEEGVERAITGMRAASDSMFLTVGIVDTALRLDRPLKLVANLYFKLGECLSLDWFMSQIVQLSPENRWQDLARESYVDDLESQRRQLTAILLKNSDTEDHEQIVEQWQVKQHHLIDRWALMVKELQHGGAGDFAVISVALRELLDLVQSTVEST